MRFVSSVSKIFGDVVSCILSPSYGGVFMRGLGLSCFFLFLGGVVNSQEIVAHRGASYDAPENTLSAFRLAWDKQADAVEGDFYLTADQEIVCIHDKDTKRTAPNQPVFSVADSTLDQLKTLDVGSWKNQRFAGERIPTLGEVLSVVPSGKKILIEIKCGKEIVPELKSQLSQCTLANEQVVIICFDPHVVHAVREAMPQYKANWLTSYREDRSKGRWLPQVDQVIEKLKLSNASGLGTQGRRSVVDEAFCKVIEDAGYEKHVWTVNDADEAKYYSGLGFQSITTDRPAFIRAAIQADSLGSKEKPRLKYQVERQVVRNGYDGKECWVHARSGVVREQTEDGISQIVLTSQLLDVKGSDTFSAISSASSLNGGETWSELVPQKGFARWQLGEQMEETICDFVPVWHHATRKLLGTGQSVRYQHGKVMKVRPRYTAYSTYDPDSLSWSTPKQLEMPDEPRFRNCGAGSVQRFDEQDGAILLPVYFKVPESNDYSVTVCKCSFDGTDLRYLRHGDEMTVKGGRGLYEPSIAKVNDRYFLTLRNDATGYVCSSKDGLTFSEPKPWTFEDGQSLGNYNTQQHWVRHNEDLYLVYTRRGADNDHVFRHRAPLFMAEVNQDSLTIKRETEIVLVAERGARLGNFGVMELDDSTTWVVVSEWMQTWKQSSVILPVDNPHGADNSIFIAKIKWSEF